MCIHLASSKIFLTTFGASLAAELAEAKIDVLVIVSLLRVQVCKSYVQSLTKISLFY